jgi:hypothetical protein
MLLPQERLKKFFRDSGLQLITLRHTAFTPWQNFSSKIIACFSWTVLVMRIDLMTITDTDQEGSNAQSLLQKAETLQVPTG